MRAYALVLLAACGGSKSDKDGVAVQLAAVTLADDCGDAGWMPPPTEPPPEARQDRARAASNEVESVARCAGDDCGRYRGCSQTSMQVSFSADHASVVKVKKVELLDGQGKYIEDLTARGAKQWDGSKYIAWDEKLAPTKPIQASYALSAPSWDKLGGRSKAQGQKLNVHVVVTIDDTEHSLEKGFVIPVHRTPDVVTMN